MSAGQGQKTVLINADHRKCVRAKLGRLFTIGGA
jgi:hypothetical protein